MWADQASFCEEEVVSVAGNFSRHNIVIYCYELYSNLYILFLRCALESYRQSWETTRCCNGLRWQNVVPILWCAPKFNRKMNTSLRQILGDVEGRWRNSSLLRSAAFGDENCPTVRRLLVQNPSSCSALKRPSLLWLPAYDYYRS